MNAVVVVESMFGNTRQVAEAVAAEIAGVVADASQTPAKDLANADLLVLGGPTHAHGLSRFGTRKAAINQGAPAPTANRGAREFVAALPPGNGRLAACFDTRLPHSRWLTGSASKGLARGLRRRGYRVLGPSGSFAVTHSAGPLVEGELERARVWGRQLLPKLEQPRRNNG